MFSFLLLLLLLSLFVFALLFLGDYPSKYYESGMDSLYFCLKRSTKKKYIYIFKVQNVRCYHLNNGCGHEHVLLYTVPYSASSVLHRNFLLRVFYERVTLSEIYSRSVLSDDSDKIGSL